MLRPSLIASLLLCCLTAAMAPATAQDGLPTMDELLARLDATPVPGPAGPSDPKMPTPFALPPDPPADAAIVTAIAATIRELVACANTGHPLYQVPFSTDACLRRTPFTEEWVEFVDIWLGRSGVPVPDPEEQEVLLGMREARLLTDGRVGALVDWLFPLSVGSPLLQTEFVTFAEQPDRRWLVDEVVRNLETQYPSTVPGVPTALPEVRTSIDPVLIWC